MSLGCLGPSTQRRSSPYVTRNAAERHRATSAGSGRDAISGIAAIFSARSSRRGKHARRCYLLTAGATFDQSLFASALGRALTLGSPCLSWKREQLNRLPHEAPRAVRKGGSPEVVEHVCDRFLPTRLLCGGDGGESDALDQVNTGAATRCRSSSSCGRRNVRPIDLDDEATDLGGLLRLHTAALIKDRWFYIYPSSSGSVVRS